MCEEESSTPRALIEKALDTLIQSNAWFPSCAKSEAIRLLIKAHIELNNNLEQINDCEGERQAEADAERQADAQAELEAEACYDDLEGGWY